MGNVVSPTRNPASLDDYDDSNNKDDEEEAAAAAEATDGIKHPAWFGKAEGYTGKWVEGRATTNWSIKEMENKKKNKTKSKTQRRTQARRGSDFLAEGGWLSAWEDQRLQRGLTPHSVTVIWSLGLLVRVGDGLIYPFFFQSPFFFTTMHRFHNMATRGGIFSIQPLPRPHPTPPTALHLFTPL